MKYSMMIKLYLKVYSGMIKKDVRNKDDFKAIKNEYKAIMLRAKDIGSKNNLLGSYTLAALFIAMNRILDNDVETNYQILEKGMKNSKLLKLVLGNQDSYLSEKKLKQRLKWSKETYERKYENDWVVEILPKCSQYDLGYNYHECGVCKLCKDENCFSYAKYLCKLDFLLFRIIGLKLTRTKTLAEGGDFCDFRMKKEGD